MYTCPHCGWRSVHEIKSVCSKCGQPVGPQAPKPIEVSEEAVRNVIVSTGDLPFDYRIISPVYFSVTNKGLFSSQYKDLENKYNNLIEEWAVAGQDTGNELRAGDVLLAFGLGEWSAGHNLFDKAFLMAMEELKKRAALLDGDGIIYLRQDIDLDTNGFQYFYLQMYGTAVRIAQEG